MTNDPDDHGDTGLDSDSAASRPIAAGLPGRLHPPQAGVSTAAQPVHLDRQAGIAGPPQPHNLLIKEEVLPRSPRHAGASSITSVEVAAAELIRRGPSCPARTQ